MKVLSMEYGPYLHKRKLAQKEVFEGITFKQWASVKVMTGILTNPQMTSELRDRAKSTGNTFGGEIASEAVRMIDHLVKSLEGDPDYGGEN